MGKSISSKSWYLNYVLKDKEEDLMKGGQSLYTKSKIHEWAWWIFFHKLGEINVSPDFLTGFFVDQIRYHMKKF